MANVFEGRPDARQSTDERSSVSRFRPFYRAMSDDEKALHDAIKDKAAELEMLFTQVKPMGGPSRYKSLAMTSLEESVMWIVKDLTN